MPDYKNSKIYKIESLIGNVVYYGATTQKLYMRWSKHKRNYVSGKGCYSRFVLQYEDAKMILVKNCPCNSKEELTRIEWEYIKNNDCVNKQKNLIRTKEDIKQYHQKWRNEHKEETKEYNKKWALDNKLRKKKNDRLYYDKIKDKLLKKITCECGSKFALAGKIRHEKTTKHKNFILSCQ